MHSHYDKRIRAIRDLDCCEKRIYLELEVRRVQCSVCGKVKTERLEWLAKNPHFTRRFAMNVGKMCREQTVSRVGGLLRYLVRRRGTQRTGFGTFL